jgi:hypothetical protein
MIKKALFITVISSVVSFLLGSWIGFAYIENERKASIQSKEREINDAKKTLEANEKTLTQLSNTNKKEVQKPSKKPDTNINKDKTSVVPPPTKKPAAPVKSKNTLPSKEESKKEVNKDVKKEDPKEAAKKAATKSNDI